MAVLQDYSGNAVTLFKVSLFLLLQQNLLLVFYFLHHNLMWCFAEENPVTCYIIQAFLQLCITYLLKTLILTNLLWKLALTSSSFQNPFLSIHIFLKFSPCSHRGIRKLVLQAHLTAPRSKGVRDCTSSLDYHHIYST